MQSNKFTIRSIEAYANNWWQSEDARYYENASALLAELIIIADKIKKDWPAEKSSINKTEYPNLYELGRKRDLVSDSVLIFSAMAVEGFVNFYGVLRLGEKVYQEYFERLPQEKKIKALLLFCDAIDIDNSHPLIKLSTKLARKRNNLLHPKTKEFSQLPAWESRSCSDTPETAIQAVKYLDDFFIEFVSLVPEANWLIPSKLKISS